MIKVAINGFGRIGSLTFRAAIRTDDIEVVAINAPGHPASQIPSMESLKALLRQTMRRASSLSTARRSPFCLTTSTAIPHSFPGVKWVLNMSLNVPAHSLTRLPHRLILTQAHRSL